MICTSSEAYMLTSDSRIAQATAATEVRCGGWMSISRFPYRTIGSEREKGISLLIFRLSLCVPQCHR